MGDFVAGLIAGLSGCIVGYPFDVIKTYSQVDGTKNTWLTCRLIYDRHGLKGFYKGILSSLLSRSIIKATLFHYYEQSLKLQSSYQYNIYIKMGVAGFIASFPVCILYCPLEISKLYAQRGFKFHNLNSNQTMFKQLSKGFRETFIR